MKYLTAVVLMLSVFACDTHPVGLSDAEKEKIDNFLKEYRQAWLSNDTGKVMNTLSEDIILYFPGSTPAAKGKAEVKAIWFPQSFTKYPIRKYEISNQEIEGSGRLAVVTGKSILVWQTVKADSVLNTNTDSTEFISFLTKENNGWKIKRQMFQKKN